MEEDYKYDISEEIKSIKNFYNISRRTLRFITGILEDALKRYERGELAPRKFMLLITSCLNIAVFNDAFHGSKQLLKASVIHRIEKKILSELQWRTREVRGYEYKALKIDFEPN